MHHVIRTFIYLKVLGYIMALQKKGFYPGPVEKLHKLILTCSTHDTLHLAITFGN